MTDDLSSPSAQPIPALEVSDAAQQDDGESPSQGEGKAPDMYVDNDTPPFLSLAPQHIPLEQRVGYIVALVVSGVIIAATSPLLWFAWDHPWAAWLVVGGWLLLVGGFFWLAHFWPPIAHRHTSWRLSETGMEIRRGVLWKHRIAIPIARVQHVDVSQGPLQRLFAIGKLTVHTAGTTNASIELDGLPHSQAMQVRDQLIEQKELLDVT